MKVNSRVTLVLSAPAVASPKATPAKNKDAKAPEKSNSLAKPVKNPKPTTAAPKPTTAATKKPAATMNPVKKR
jgi:hypothetical protein